MQHTDPCNSTRGAAWLIRAGLLILFTLIALTLGKASAQEAQSKRDIAYKPQAESEYERSRCKLDLYLPAEAKEFATLIWFHGGGLENGDKQDAIALGVAERFSKAGIAVVSVNYRLSPTAKYPSYIQDAAAAVAHVHHTIAQFGGDPARLFVSGHSAGGYLTAMLATAPEYLNKERLQPSDLAGFIPVSGQMFTHSTVRKERGLPRTQPVIDEAAPAWYVHADVPPMLCIWGTEDLPTRAEENAYFIAAARAAGSKSVVALPVEKRSHDTSASRINQPNDDVATKIETFIREHRAQSTATEKPALRIKNDDKTITLLDGEQPLLVYNLQSPPAPKGIDAIYERSGFLHPVYSPGGQVLTAAFPADHAHQHGIFSAWVKTSYADNSVDFWNLPGKTGRVLHENIVSQFNDEMSVGFEVSLLHRVLSDPPVDVLRESWKITAHSTDSSYYCFDLETVQRALTDKPLVIEKYHYGGVAVRGPVKWVLKPDGDLGSADASPREPNGMLNSLGNDRIAGNHAHTKWVAMSGHLDGKPSGIVMLDHPENFRAPQAARLHPTKPYFCMAPCVDGEFVIDADHPYHARYRFLVTDTKVDPEWIQEQWQKWTGGN